MPNTAIEAQACGVPVVALSTGGLCRILLFITNRLARAFDTGDMAEGIKWVLEDDNRWVELSQAARENAVQKFSPIRVAEQYAAVYQHIHCGR